mmetsp:Transcript_14078/g.41788  ORF Transcript_14078/g.41788 Transcript_14078/m.41788 type:complete len:308 (-) Transcript_14078:406-1329(-)
MLPRVPEAPAAAAFGRAAIGILPPRGVGLDLPLAQQSGAAEAAVRRGAQAEVGGGAQGVIRPTEIPLLTVCRIQLELGHTLRLARSRRVVVRARVARRELRLVQRPDDHIGKAVLDTSVLKWSHREFERTGHAIRAHARADVLTHAVRVSVQSPELARLAAGRRHAPGARPAQHGEEVLVAEGQGPAEGVGALAQGGVLPEEAWAQQGRHQRVRHQPVPARVEQGGVPGRPVPGSPPLAVVREHADSRAQHAGKGVGVGDLEVCLPCRGDGWAEPNAPPPPPGGAPPPPPAAAVRAQARARSAPAAR